MEESKEFKTCPACGGKNRLCEGMANEVKGRGLARPEWTLNLQSFSAVAIDPSMAASIPIGSEVPAMRTSIDICTDCGCVYATRYDRGGAKKEPTVTRVSMPVRTGN